MGLAASQARLLTITARKGDCEFQSMTLSHQKLEMSRNLENISAEYQEALNATKLVFGYSSGVDVSSYDVTSTNYTNGNIDLTYGALMTPNAYNEYYPKMVTDNANRCILDSSLAAAARAAGIPAEGLGCTPSSDVRDKFVDALASNQIITTVQSEVIKETPYSYSVGNGDTSSVTTVYADVSAEELMGLLEVNSCSTWEYGLQFGNYSTCDNGAYAGDPYGAYYEVVNTKKETNGPDNKNTTQDLSLRELLSTEDDKQIVLSYCQWGDTNIAGAAALQDQLAGVNGNLGNGCFLDYLVEQFSNVLGGVQENEEAIAYAYSSMYDLIVPNTDILQLEKSGIIYTGDDYSWDISKRTTRNTSHPEITGSSLTMLQEFELLGVVALNHPDKDEDWFPYCVDNAYNSVGIASTASDCNGDKKKKFAQVSVSLNNITQAFLTKIVEYLDGGTGCSEYYANTGYLNQSNLFDINSDNFTFTTVDSVEVDDGDDNYYARFYDAMFNQICLNGWVENDDVDDYEYLSEMFKNGQAFINSISNDGHYYQSSYSSANFVSEVSDETKIAAAEAKYNTEKARLENKEDTIDIKMKNLDTEISSLTTEYDTVKSVISKAIEKSFKRYDA